jgi:hypothetical protein
MKEAFRNLMQALKPTWTPLYPHQPQPPTPPLPSEVTPCAMAGVAHRAIKVEGKGEWDGVYVQQTSASEKQHQAWAADYLRKHGSITLRDIRLRGCNSPAKVIFRLRKAGVVLPKEQDTWHQNAKGDGRHKRYYAKNKGREVR